MQSNEKKAESVLEFWSSAGPAKWWTTNKDFDRSIREKFLDIHCDAAAGKFDNWEYDCPDSALALIIVLDQFSRNLYREDAKTYSCDKQALAITHRVIARGDDRRMRGDISEFVYMPLMHSENLHDQNLSVSETERTQGPGDIESARGHRNIILRFGRFPHRNVILGRKSTPEELAFLENGGFQR